MNKLPGISTLGTLVTLTLFCASTPAQTINPQVSLAKQGTTQKSLQPIDGSDNHEYVRSLLLKVAREERCILLIDGMASRLPKFDTNLAKQIDSLKGNAQARVSVLAESLDCDVNTSGSVFFLTHRYQSGNALPAITIPECVAFLGDMESILQQFQVYNPKRTSGPVTRYEDRIVKSFSESQWRIMKDEGLPVSKLGPEQERLVSSFGASFFVDDGLRTVSHVKARFQEISSEEARFTSKIMDGQKVYGVEFPSGSGELVRTLFLPLTAPGAFRLDSDGTFSSGKLFASSQQSEEETSKEANFSIVNKRDSPTLIETIQGSNNWLIKNGPVTPGDKIVTVDVDKSVADKPLEIFGGEHISPQSLAEMVSKLYNLRVSNTKSSTTPQAVGATVPNPRLLERRPRIGLGNMSDIAPATRCITPSPLMRYIYNRLLQKTATERQKQIEQGLGGTPLALPPGISFQQTSALPNDLRQKAAEVLLAYALKLDSDNVLATKPVPVSELSPQVRSAIANFVIAEICDNLPSYLAEPPAYVSNLQNGMVRAEVRDVDGIKRYWLMLKVPFASNKPTDPTIKSSVVSIGSVKYPQ